MAEPIILVVCLLWYEAVPKQFEKNRKNSRTKNPKNKERFRKKNVETAVAQSENSKSLKRPQTGH